MDEVLSVGDIAFQAQCSQKMRELLKSGKTIVLVSHSLALIQSLCNRVILLQRGKVVMDGNTNDVIPQYQNIVLDKEEEEFRKKVIDPEKVKLDVKTAVSINSVTFVNDEGKEKKKFMSDEPINVMVDYDAGERIQEPTFFVEIVRTDGVSCCASSSRQEMDFIDHIEGKGTTHINLGKLRLASGVYMVKLSVWDKDMLHPLVMRDQDVIRVVDNGTVLYAKPVFLPEIKWDVVK